MSLLGKAVQKAVIHKIEEETVDGIARHLANTRSVEAIAYKSDAKHILLIKKKSVSIKRGFIVVDEDNNKKYIIKKGIISFGSPNLYLYDLQNQEIGRVELESKFRKREFSIYIGSKKVDRLKGKPSIRLKLDLDNKGWHLEGNTLRNSFIVTDRFKKKVLKITNAFSGQETYVLELNNREHEILGILLFMAIEIELHGND